VILSVAAFAGCSGKLTLALAAERLPIIDSGSCDWSVVANLYLPVLVLPCQTCDNLGWLMVAAVILGSSICCQCDVSWQEWLLLFSERKACDVPLAMFSTAQAAQ
jgi:hypothetical protein